ncbi:hypothetical protein SAMN05421770_10659 [Granulicella rosea]|uniref:DUF5666 domain-containing protein n=1 Tax=Granulicella rosea TaxID=474952 RepID=A0A239L1Y1_9BACT|nr:hypothetical protein [Granulicella rosea]SNT24617.1 hypothetical protein SAMN05421770_10659 [Granulicella rosea]
MKFAAKATVALSLLAIPSVIFAQATPASSDANNKMVAAHGALTQNLDAKKVTVGSEFSLKLSKPVKLDNGTTLPGGTVLVGTVAQDDQSVAGNAKLALRFTHANLKSGQVVPIHATIVGVARTDGSLPDNWTPTTQKVDQIGVVSDVDLHSRVASKNSGVFVATKKDNVKLLAGSEIALAIGSGDATPTDITNVGGNGGN